MMELSYVKNLRESSQRDILGNVMILWVFPMNMLKKSSIILDHLIYGVKRKINGLENKNLRSFYEQNKKK